MGEGIAMNSVDVVIPAFNAKETIALAIDSVLGQSAHVVRKIIVVDDGSSDGTGRFVRKINSNKIEIKRYGHTSSDHEVPPRIVL